MTTLSRSFLVAALALSAGSVVSAQQAPARTPPPPTPRRDTVPALPPPYRPAPPPRAAAPARAAAQPATAAAPLRPATRPSRVPPESVATRAPRPDTTPTGATGRCRDGTWLTGAAAPSACATHRGLAFALEASPPPQRPVPAAAARIAATPAMQANLTATPPSGATMRCKNGEWLSGTPSTDRCATRGGVAVILRTARQTPPVPLRQH